MSSTYQSKLAGLLSLLIVSQTLVMPVFAAGATDLSPLEVKFFSHPYDKDSTGERLDRLEKLVFGNTQSGSTEERIARLSSTVTTAEVPTDKPALSQNQTARAEEAAKAAEASRAAAKASAQADTYDYPAVAQLEKSLLGKSYKGEAVQQRLNRLESKAFGAPSKVEDMALRVDKLNNYASTYGMQPGDEKLFAANTPAGGSNFGGGYGANRGAGFGSGAMSGSNPGMGMGSGAMNGSNANGMVEKVAILENKVLGGTSTNQPLIHRIKKLEDKVYGKPLSNSEDMNARVDKLWLAVKPDASDGNAIAANQPTTAPFNSAKSGKKNSSSNNQYWAADPSNNGSGDSFNNSTAYNPSAGYGANSYGSNGSYYGSTNKHGKQKSPSSSHGSILGKIGKVAVFAGSAALGAGAVAAGAMGGGYGGYGGGYGSYGMGGYSPYRSYMPSYGYGSYGSPYASSYAGSFFSR